MDTLNITLITILSLVILIIERLQQHQIQTSLRTSLMCFSIAYVETRESAFGIV